MDFLDGILDLVYNILQSGRGIINQIAVDVFLAWDFINKRLSGAYFPDIFNKISSTALANLFFLLMPFLYQILW